MILEFILRAPYAPKRYRLEGMSPTGIPILLLPHRQAPVAQGLIERILVTNQDEEPEQVRTWLARPWELRLYPSRMWVLRLVEITRVPGEIIPGRVAT